MFTQESSALNIMDEKQFIQEKQRHKI